MNKNDKTPNKYSSRDAFLKSSAVQQQNMYNDFNKNEYQYNAPTPTYYDDSDQSQYTAGSLGEHLKLYGNTKEYQDSDKNNTLAYITQQLANTLLSNKEEDIRRDKNNEKALQMIEERNNILNELNKLKESEYSHYFNFDINSGKVIINTQERINTLQNALNSIDRWLMSDGRRMNSIVAKAMFDPTKASAIDDISMFTYNSSDFRNTLNRSDYETDEDYFRGLKRQDNRKWYDKALDALGDAVSSAFNFVKNTATTTAEAVGTPLGSRRNGNALDYIRSVDLDIDDEYGSILRKMYKTGVVDQKLINDLRTEVQKDYNQHLAELHHRLDFAKSGKLWTPKWVRQLTPISVAISSQDENNEYLQFDVKPDEAWVKEHEAVSEHWYNFLWHPTHAVAEIGSTLSLYGAQLGAMGIDGALSYAGKKALDYLGPTKKVKWLQSLLTSASIGTHIGASVISREEETKSEAIEAISERALQDAADSGADMGRVLSELKDQLENKYQIKTDSLDERDLITLACSFGLKTSDDKFNLAVAGSAKGINKLINANNALAVVDYFQSLPFMNYGGKIMSEVAQGARKTVTKTIGRTMSAFSEKPFQAAAKFYRSSNAYIHRGLLDATLEKAAKSWLKNSPKLLLYGSSVAKYLTKRAPLMIGEALSESIEEGQQNLLQYRFKKGDYDKFNKQEQMLDVREIFGDAELAATAVANYYGYGNMEDSARKELVKAMNIGFWSSFAFSQGSHVASNLTGSRNDNITGLIRDLKTDKMVLDLVQNQYEHDNITSHADDFYRRMKGGRTTAADINQKLTFLKKSNLLKDLNIEEEWINDDMRLAQFMEIALNNPNISNKKILEEYGKKYGIKKNNEKYRKMMVDQAKIYFDLFKLHQTVQKNYEGLDKMISEKKDILDKMFDETTSQEELEEIENTKFGQVIKKLMSEYERLTKQHETKTAESKNTFKQALIQYAKNLESVDGLPDEMASEYIVRSMNNENTDDVVEDLFQRWSEDGLTAKNLEDINSGNALNNAFIYRYLKSKVWDDSLRQGQNQAKMIQYLRENGKTDAQKAAIAREAAIYNRENPQKKKDFVLGMLRRLDSYKRMQARTMLRQQLQNQASRLADIKKLTGMNINIEGLLGAIDTLDEHNEKFKKQLDKMFKDGNIFENGEWEVEGEEDYMNMVKAMAMNNAILPAMSRIAQAYRQGYAMPSTLSEAIFGKNYEAADTDDPFYEYKSYVDEYNKNSETEKSAIEEKKDLELSWKRRKKLDKQIKKSRARQDDLSTDVAWKMIADRISDTERRQRQEEEDIAEDIAEESGVQVQAQPQAVAAIQQDGKSDAEVRLGNNLGHGSFANKQDDRKQQEINERRKTNKQNKAEEQEAEEEEVQEQEQNEESSNTSGQQNDTVTPTATTLNGLINPIAVEEDEDFEEDEDVEETNNETLEQVEKELNNQNEDQEDQNEDNLNISSSQPISEDVNTGESIASEEDPVQSENSSENEDPVAEPSSSEQTSINSTYSPSNNTLDVNISSIIQPDGSIVIDVENDPLIKHIIDFFETHLTGDLKVITHLERSSEDGVTKKRGPINCKLTTNEDATQLSLEITLDDRSFNDKLKTRFDDNTFKAVLKRAGESMSEWTVLRSVDINDGIFKITLVYNRDGSLVTDGSSYINGGKGIYYIENIDSEQKQVDPFAPAQPVEKEPSKEEQEEIDEAISQLDEEESAGTRAYEEFIEEEELNSNATEQTEEEEVELELAQQENDEAEEYASDVNHINLISYDEDGIMMYDGERLSPRDQELMEQQLELMSSTIGFGIAHEDLPTGAMLSADMIRNMATSDDIGNVICDTFFYDPEATETVFLTVGENQVVLDKPLATGKELGEKLATPGWLDKVLQNDGAYYIVTASQDALKLENNNSAHKADPRDAFSVALILEDENNSYYCALRNLEQVSYKDEKGVKHKTKGELRLRNELRRKNLDLKKVAAELGLSRIDADSDIYDKVNNLLAQKYKEAAEKLFESVIITQRRNLTFDAWYKGKGLTKQEQDIRLQALKDVATKIRKEYAKPGKRILSEAEIDHQIEALRELRNQIIDEYLIAVPSQSGKTVHYKFPSSGTVEVDRNGKKEIAFKVKRTVKPERVVQSNGKINSIKDELRNPVYRPIVEESQSVQDIEHMITSGQLVLGYGRGLAVKDDPFAISNVFGDLGNVLIGGNDTKSRRAGVAGKIFHVIPSPFGEDKGLVPIMLAEELFDFQQKADGSINWLGDKDKLQLCLTINEQGEIESNNSEYLPSAAEVLLYMMCGKFDTGTQDFDIRQSIVEFFIHHGENTLFENQPRYQEVGLQQFAMKQLSVDRMAGGTIQLSIALPVQVQDENGIERTSYQLHTFQDLDNSVFADTEEAIQNRKAIVHAIATQMHWNTDISHMQSTINAAKSGTDIMSNFVRFIVEKYGKSLKECNGDVQEYLDQEVSILGCPQLTFKMSDFFEDGTGKPGGYKVIGKNVLTAAWMIKNGKLKTDVGEQMFYAPFVFANGVRKESQVRQQVQAAQNAETESKIQSVAANEPISPVVENELQFANWDQLTGEYGILETLSINEEELGVTKTAEDRQSFIDEQNQNSSYLKMKGYTLLDRIALYSKDVDMSPNEVIDQFIDSYNEKNGTKIEYKHLKDNQVNMYNDGGVIKCDILKDQDGNLFVNVDVLTDFQNNYEKKFTGVYSKVKGKGKLNIDKARQWLHEKLGINPDNVILWNAIMRGADNEQIFGLTNVATDVLSNQLTGIITLSSEAGEGIHYHEAWHFVNLLMHDQNQREAIYESYLKRHKVWAMFKKPSYADVEERLAEEFRKYIQGYEDDSLVGKVKRMFENVLNFLCIAKTGNGSLYKQIFEEIKNGEYRAQQINQKEISDFVKKYPEGVYSIKHKLSGVDNDAVSKLTVPQRYQEFYDAADAVVEEMFRGLRLDSVHAIRDFARGKSFNEMANDAIERLMQNDTNSQNEHNFNLLVELQQNIGVLYRTFEAKVTEMGFKIRDNKVENIGPDGKEESNMDDDPENNYDKVDIETSMKDNAAANTKLFFRSIPKYNITVVFNKETGKYENRYDTVYSEFGVPQTWSYTEAWNKILNELWLCTSYGKMAENGIDYLDTSIRGRVKQLAKTDPFFYALDQKLNSLEGRGRKKDDTQLKSQIFSTVNCYKNPVSYIKLEDPTIRYNFDEEEEDEEEYDVDQGLSFLRDDRNRVWKLSDDGNLRSAVSIPRTWSKTFASSGFIYYDRSTKQSVSNRNKVNSLKTKLEQIQSMLTRADYEVKLVTSKRSDKYKNVEEFYTNFVYGSRRQLGFIQHVINLANEMGIPLDVQTLQIFSNKLNISAKSANEKLFRSLKHLVDTNNVKSGFSDIINKLNEKSNINATKLIFDGKERALDEVFSKYSHKHVIGVLAMSYNEAHPQLSEYSVKSPNGETVYPINMNNYVTDVTRDLNDKKSGLVERLLQSSYAQNSVLLEIASGVKDNVPEDERIRVKTFIGMKDNNNLDGSDYFGITPMEDYLSKMFITQNDQLVFPTMADKKKWYSIQAKNLKLCHDTVQYTASALDYANARNIEFDKSEEGQEWISKNSKTRIDSFGDEVLSEQYLNAVFEWDKQLKHDAEHSTDETRKKYAKDKLAKIRRQSIRIAQNANRTDIGYRRFSDSTLNIFCGYFLSELNTLIDYFDENNILRLQQIPSSRIGNYHGKFSDFNGESRMDMSGNGGKFRYFYDVDLSEFADTDLFKNIKLKYGKGKQTFNLNHIIQALWNLQRSIENGKKIEDLSGTSELMRITPNSNNSFDGFELIRQFLHELRSNISEVEGQYSDSFRDAINNKLIQMVDIEMERVSQDGSSLQLCTKSIDTFTGQVVYIPTKVPTQLMKRASDQMSAARLIPFGNVYDLKPSQSLAKSQVLYSTIANFVVNQMMSVIEVEKVYAGDPAFYKEKANKADKTSKVTLSYSSNATGQQCEFETEVENLEDMYSDKIKRLGGLLSPGQEIRMDFSEKELKNDPRLFATQYSVLDVEDIECESVYLDIIKNNFKTQLVIDTIRTGDRENFIKFLPTIQKKLNLDILPTYEEAIDYMYGDIDLVEQYYDTLSDAQKTSITNSLKQQVRPYSGINVCDAQVFIRPEMYRKIRIGLGDWSFIPDKTGYSDEEAYKIIMSNANWMHDEKLAAKVNRFQLYALKMSYFGHESKQFATQLNMPLYNKMAIFPMFPFHASSNVGKMIYNRMNLAGHEIDMIAFKSAVKVGAVQKAPNLTKTDANSTEAITQLNDFLDINEDGSPKYINSHSLDYTNDCVTDMSNSGKPVLPVKIQKLSNIRMQLNTHAHESEARAIGTQMFKIAFSNIVEDAKYGDKTGKEVRDEIIDCINKLTLMGVEEIRAKFYDQNENGTYDVNDAKVRDYMLRIIKNNGLGSSAEEIVKNGGVAAGLMSRTVFENSMSVIVNDAVVNINTKGGTAIQQSVFGFAGYGAQNVQTAGEEGQEVVGSDGKTFTTHDYKAYNNGEELKWNAEDGSMEVILSMNFFKPVVPKVFQNTYTNMRQWLINHDVIKGTKKNISVVTKSGLVEQDIVEKEGVQSNPKPFGIGYRIPTQGQSSMFAYTVADVLPSTVGDLIIVPREFTAQTGSDFDVDKIYLSNMSYFKGKLQTDMNTKEGISNRLLENYMKIITDKKHYAGARASIDVITSKLQDELLNPYLRKKSNGYLTGMTQLLPSFQALRKMEFGVGKTGIGPFALNVTNLALTQAANISMDYGSNEYGFGDLNETLGKDENRIADWLSAMVNAHVDVAKDPYVFDLNINQATYKHANFLIRAGMGIATFRFLAQPILKEFCNKVNSSGGIYQGNPAMRNGDPTAQSQSKRQIANALYEKYVKLYESLYGEDKKLLYFKAKYDSELRKSNDKNKLFAPIDKKFIFQPKAEFGTSLAEHALQNPTSQEGLLYQLQALDTFQDIEPYANAISKLVTLSQIDTKKFGNSIIQQRNWANNLYQFIYGADADCGFVVKEDWFDKEYPIGEKEKGGYSSKERSIAALMHYYDKTYLMSKFESAYHFTRDALKTQLISATPAHIQLFDDMCKLMNGTVEYFQGSPKLDQEQNSNLNVETYSPIQNKEIVQEISNKLDNIQRFQALTLFGPELYDPNSDMIDFTCGGSIDRVVSKTKGLLFGEDRVDGKSLFERINDLVVDIKTDPNKEVETVDAFGKQIKTKAHADLRSKGDVSNDLLKYLIPMMPTNDFPVGRILLASPQTFTPEQMKNRYRTAFYQLLQHRVDYIRELAQDIVFYAYYSSYDQNTANSFFDLVPYEYRQQYDKALTKYLNSTNSQSEEFIEKKGLSSMIMDTMCRNFWYDEQLVPTVYPNNDDSLYFVDDEEDFDDEESDQPDIIYSKSNLEITLGSNYDEEARYAFPGVLLSTTIKSLPKTKLASYVKVTANGKSYLYKHIGSIRRSRLASNGKKFNQNPIDIFIMVPKAGLHKAKMNQFEFYANDEYDSVFDYNMLPGDMAEDVLRDLIMNRLQNTGSSIILNGGVIKQGENGQTLEVSFFNENVPSLRRSSNANAYYESTAERIKNKQHLGLIKLNEQSLRPYKDATAAASVSVVLSANAILGKSSDDKTVSVRIGQNIEKTASIIAEKYSGGGGPILFTTYQNDYQLSNIDFEGEYKNKTDRRTVELIKQHVETFAREISNNPEVSKEDAESMIATEREKLEKGGSLYKKYRNMAAQEVINEYISELLKEVYDKLDGKKIHSIATVAEKDKRMLGYAINNASIVNRDYIESEQNNIYIESGQNTTFKRSKQYRQFKQILNNQIYQLLGSAYKTEMHMQQAPEASSEDAILRIINEANQQDDRPSVDVDVTETINEVKQDGELRNKDCASTSNTNNSTSSQNNQSSGLSENQQGFRNAINNYIDDDDE